MRMKLAVLGLAVLLAAGCEKKKDDAAKGAEGAKADPATGEQGVCRQPALCYN